MSVPFDHLYACHLSEPTTTPPSKDLNDRLARFTRENRMLKNLLLVNLDLVQQQSDRLVTKDKTLLTLKKENAMLKSKIDRLNRRVNVPRSMLQPPPLVPVQMPPPPLPPTPSSSSAHTSQVTLNKYTELLITDTPSSTTTMDQNLDKNSICYLPTDGDLSDLLNISDINSLLKATEADLSKPKSCFFSENDEFLLDVTSLDNEPDLLKPKDISFGQDTTSLLSDMSRPSNIVTAADRLKQTISREKETLGSGAKETFGGGNKDTFGRRDKDTFGSKKKPETATSRIRNTPTKVKSATPALSQFYKSRNATLLKTSSESESTKAPSKSYNSLLSLNKKCKMIHTYGKTSKPSTTATTTSKASEEKTTTTSRLYDRRLPYTGALSDRLKLIDITPTGEDPYQLGEADMREQSPIPKLMLQKSAPKTKIFCGDNYTCTSETRKLLDQSIIGEAKNGRAIKKIKLNKYSYGSPYMFPGEKDDDDDDDSSFDEDFLDQRPSLPIETSVCDFSYGESSRNISSRINFDNDSIFNQDFDLLLDSPVSDSKDVKDAKFDMTDDKEGVNKKKSLMAGASRGKRGEFGTIKKPTPSIIIKSEPKIEILPKPDTMPKLQPVPTVPTRRRAGTSGTAKQTAARSSRKKLAPLSCTDKKPPPQPPQPMTSRTAYPTTLGDPDSCWYLGRDQEEVDQDLPSSLSIQASIEVPIWKEKVYTSCYSMEGTEDLSDDVFKKRHHKRELEEKRRKRWDLQRQREQLVVERLRRRQQDAPWYQRDAASQHSQSPHTLMPAPLSDIHYIQVVDELPVSAFGEAIPALPPAPFYLPWVRSSRPKKDNDK